MVNEKDKTYINDILREINVISEDFMETIKEDEFMEDIEKQYAVAKALENIGEASNRISDELKNEHEGIAWAQMYGVRNRISHEYRDIDYKIVWDIVKDELPEVRDKLEEVLSSE